MKSLLHSQCFENLMFELRANSSSQSRLILTRQQIQAYNACIILNKAALSKWG